MTKWVGSAPPGQPYWWADADPTPQLSDALATRVDILIIGAGYTGLSAAIAAHDGGASVVVVDAGTPGHGASTRNGGMFGAHPRLGWQALAKSFGASTADALFAEANPALNFVKSLIELENISCDLQNTGRIQLAYTRAHFEAQKQLAADVRTKSDVQVSIVERAELGAEIKTDSYFGGMLLPEHCAIHPQKFHDGLLAATVKRGIDVVADTAVIRLERVLGGFRAHTAKGTIAAQKIILATNGYSTSAFRWHQRRVFPLPSYIIATEALAPELIADLVPGQRMMVETCARHAYFRISPDETRILFGGRASMRNIDMQLAAKRLHASMCEVWPQLQDTAITHCWGGNTGFSFSHMPSVGAQDGLHYAMGYSGSGTVMAPYLGAMAGRRAVGAAGGETAYADTRFKTHWLHPTSTPHFLKAADYWYRVRVDAKERRENSVRD